MLYLSQVITYTALMCFVYVLFLRNRPMHAFNRAYLLSTVVLPLFIPFITFPETVSQQFGGAALLNVRLPEFTVGKESQPAANQTLNVFWLVYGTISSLMLAILVGKWFKLRAVINKTEKLDNGDYVLLSNTGYGPGSWDKYIFLPDNATNETVIEHERAHIRLGHTKDILFLNLLQVFFWPNIFLVWIKKELTQVHEFQADESASVNREAYSELLLSSVFNRCTLPTTHSFIIHPIKRRIMMLKKNSNAAHRALFAGLTVLATSALFFGLVTIQSCKPKKWDVTDGTFAGIVDSSVVVNGKDPVYKIASKMPEFPGDSLVQYLSNNLKYPAEAKEKKIEGRVVVSFIVQKDGSITDTDVMPDLRQMTEEEKKTHKESDPLLAAAAVDVIKNMPKWKPGEHNGQKVAVSYLIPVSFKLD